MTETASPPLVSVVVCAFNAGDLLQVAVRSALEQTYEHVEVLVVDDGSTDGSIEGLEAMADPRLRIIRQSNTGKAGAMNRALRELRGEFYALLDADDLSYPERIERQLECMLANPTVAGVFCGYDLRIDGVAVAPRSAARSIAECAADIAAFRMPGHDPTAMYRVSMVRGVEYNSELRIGEGLDYILRVGERHPMMVCGGTLYWYRVTLDGLTKADPARRIAQVQKAMRLACERRSLEESEGPAILRDAVPTVFAPEERDNNIAAHFMESVVDLCRAGRRWQAVRTGWLCARIHPLRLHYLKALIYSVVPARALRYLRRRPAYREAAT